MMLRRLYPFWLPGWRQTTLGALLLVTSAVVELLQPWPIKWLCDYVLGSRPAPHWLQNLYPWIASSDRTTGILAVCLAMIAFSVAHRVATIASQFLLIRSGNRIVQNLRCAVCDHLHRLPLAYHDRSKVGDSLYRIAYDTQAAQTMLSGAVVPMISGSVILVGMVAIMFALDPILTLTALAAAPVFWLLIKGFGRAIELRSHAYHKHESSLISLIQESLSSIRAIQAFTREPETAGRFRKQTDECLTTNERLVLVQLAFSACVGVAMAIGTAAVVGIGAYYVLQARLTLGDILVFLAYLGMLYQPMNAFSQGATAARTARTQLERVFEILDQFPEIADRPGAKSLSTVQGRLEMREVSFEYEPARPVLSKVNLTIEPGQVTAFVGRTGAGKSTLASLLLRFYDPCAGAILLDGCDLRDLPLGWLREQVSVVLQDPVLFSATIAENIAFGRAGATREQVEQAARQAQVDEFIRSLPEGYETMLGERGVNLSGGQRQRLSIARAFVKNAPLLVLDEPTSALDAHTEEALVEAIRALISGRTTIIIAHRLSTIRLADQIVVIEDGEIVEQGTHDNLIEANSAYARLYRSQQRRPELDQGWLKNSSASVVQTGSRETAT